MNVIEVDNVSKMFRLGAHTGDLRERFSSLLAPEKAAAGRKAKEFWALQDISFAVAEGESFGIIGHNGSGKSTLLKLITGIYKPTRGTFKTRGRIAALIEVGAGFHPDLTGRENVYLNGSVLGMSKRAIDRKFDEIVAFAELEKFIDTPVKRYSSGMYMRLGFAVAANVDPEIVLVDEVLAVGDESFQKKCMDKMMELRADGRTIVFISHNMDAVSHLCQRVMLLDQGHTLAVGKADETILAYRDDLAERARRREVAAKALHNGWSVEEQEAREVADAERRARAAAETAERERAAVRQASETKPTRLLGGRLLDSQGRECHTISTHDTVYLECAYRSDDPQLHPAFGVALVREEDDVVVCALNTKHDHISVGPIQGVGKFGVTFSSLSLLPGKYYFVVSLSHEHEMESQIDYDPRIAELTIAAGTPEHGLVLLPHTWHVGHQALRAQEAHAGQAAELRVSDSNGVRTVVL